MPYFLCGLLIVAVCGTLLAICAFSVLASVFTGDPASTVGMGVLSLLAALAILLVYLYCGAVLTIKRLHDLGRSGWHLLWIFATGMLGGIDTTDVSAMVGFVSTMSLVVWLGAGLWLLFAPGDLESNEYGPAPR